MKYVKINTYHTNVFFSSWITEVHKCLRVIKCWLSMTVHFYFFTQNFMHLKLLYHSTLYADYAWKSDNRMDCIISLQNIIKYLAILIWYWFIKQISKKKIKGFKVNILAPVGVEPSTFWLRSQSSIISIRAGDILRVSSNYAEI